MSSEKLDIDGKKPSPFDSASDLESEAEKVLVAQLVQESEHEIKYRTCSWQKVCVEDLQLGRYRS